MITAIIMAITAVIGVGIAAVQGITGAVQDPKMQKELAELSNWLNRNAEMKAKLQAAISERNYNKAASLILSSPYGSSVRKIQASIDADKEASKRLEDEYNRIKAKAEARMEQIQAQSASTTAKWDYKRNDVISQAEKEFMEKYQSDPNSLIDKTVQQIQGGGVQPSVPVVKKVNPIGGN